MASIMPAFGCTRLTGPCLLWLSLVISVFAALPTQVRSIDETPQVVDLSLLVSQDHPCTWPVGFPPFLINHYLRIGPLSPYNSDVLMFDENTATQFDAPTHSVAPPDSGRPNAGKFGTMSGDRVAGLAIRR
jgi:hypothetical protein